MEWLIKNNPDYKETQIDEDNLAQYPSDGGNIDLQTFEDEVVEEAVGVGGLAVGSSSGEEQGTGLWGGRYGPPGEYHHVDGECCSICGV